MGVKKTLIGSDSAGRCSGILPPGSALDFLLSSYFSNQLSLSLSLLLSLSLSLSLSLWLSEAGRRRLLSNCKLSKLSTLASLTVVSHPRACKQDWRFFAVAPFVRGLFHPAEKRESQ